MSVHGDGVGPGVKAGETDAAALCLRENHHTGEPHDLLQN